MQMKQVMRRRRPSSWKCERGFKISMCMVKRAKKTREWTFHGSRYCQLIQNANKEKRVQWARTTCTVLSTMWCGPMNPLFSWRTIKRFHVERLALHQSWNLGQSTHSKSWFGLEYQRREPRIFFSWVAPWITQCTRKCCTCTYCPFFASGYQTVGSNRTMPLATPLKQHKVFSKQTRLKCWRPHPRARI